MKLDFKGKGDWEQGLLQVVDNAFKSIMLSGQGKFADVLLAEVNQLQGIDLIQVYDKEGDYVAITHVGAYGMTLSSNYNTRPTIAEIMVVGSKHKIIRKRQSLENLINN